MAGWNCGIAGCEREFDSPEDVIVHQTTEHQRHECKVCGTIVPEGYFAIRHAFDEHTRAEYVRAYDADSSDVRAREAVKEDVEENADLQSVVQQLNADGGASR
jgi:hypothetical protein